MNKGFVIAIDGPVAAGKGTLAPILAHRLKGFYFYTGSMYRCLAFLCFRNGISIHDELGVIALLPQMKLHFREKSVFLGEEDITEKIMQQEVAQASSIVAAMPKVREVLGEKQREIGMDHVGKGQIVVTEGRDQGTKIFPKAEMKIFLTAKPEIRAKRRLLQLREMGDASRTFETLLEEVKQRDRQDQERATDPLVKEPEKYGYFVVDDSEMTKDETVEVIISELKRRELIV